MTKLERYNTIRFALLALENEMRREMKSTRKSIEKIRESDYNQTTKDKEIGELITDMDYYEITGRNANALLRKEFGIITSKTLEQIDN